MSRTLLQGSSCIGTLICNRRQLQSPTPSSLLGFRKFVSIAIIHRQRGGNTVSIRCSAGDTAADGGDSHVHNKSDTNDVQEGFWSKWKVDTTEMSSKLAKLGMAAVLAYGLFDGVTYTTFFVLAFLGYEKSTGKNPAANIQALLGIVILMWTGNNVTRPFRVAGAAALAPAIEQGLKKIQKHFHFSKQVYAFALVVSAVATICLSIVGLLILSRWGGK